MRVSLRERILQLHRVIGLSIGLFVVMVAVTGAGMLFRAPLEPVIYHDLLKVALCKQRLPLDTLIANASASNPVAGRPKQLRIYDDADSSTRVLLSDDRWYYVNPCTGEVLGSEHRYGGLFGTMARLHSFQFLENGSVVAGTLALTFAIVLVGGGLAVWIPGALRKRRRAVTIKPNITGRARWLNLHKTLGVYVSLILLASALTGALQSFQFVRDALYTLTASKPPAPSPRLVVQADAQRLPVEALWQRAQALVPQPKYARIRYPGKPGDAFNIDLVARDASHVNAFSYVSLDASTGKVLRFTPYAENSLGHRIYLTALALHYGWLSGGFMQVLQLIGMLSVPVLACAGIGSYLRGKRRRPAPVSPRTTLALKVARKTAEAENIQSFELVDPAGKALPPFSAGSHIDIHVPGGKVRQYSLCNPPGERHRYLIAVMRAEPTRGGSRAMHEQVKEGDLIDVSAPKNHFPLVESAKHSLLIAGGIGITPILCMAEDLADLGADFKMHYFARSPARAAFVDRIKRSKFADRVFFHFTEDQKQQRLDLAALLETHDAETHLYVCGGEAFMNAVIDTALQKRWHKNRIHREYFSVERRESDSNVEFDVTIASTGKTICIPADKTVMAALADYGIHITTSCEQGVCGTCVTRVLEGEPQHRDVFLSDDEKNRNDRFTPCCSRANSRRLVLDL
ncbi:PepSY domain-containing protein [Paraburkholderia lacunae]|uniref:Flavodoxin reductase n=1 Tax=Paraburkholderia lacunae TaxID=2211104 RepID=A0A370ND77_9BURK|nr:flavodoxin reductase [Paraburkholderia lacunae]